MSIIHENISLEEMLGCKIYPKMDELKVSGDERKVVELRIDESQPK